MRGYELAILLALSSCQATKKEVTAPSQEIVQQITLRITVTCHLYTLIFEQIKQKEI